jgi:Lon protease-like protein
MGREAVPTKTIPSVVALFPLPNAVLFPGTVLPLHIFEPRYRSMVRDCSLGDGLIGIALLRPGYEKDYDGSPAIHSVGTVGRIEQLNPLADGRFTLNLVGLQRVEYHEIPSDKAYRLARVSLRPESNIDESNSRIGQLKLELLANQAMLFRELSDGELPALVLSDETPYSVAVNGACANLPVPGELRQKLLLVDDLDERQRRVSHLIGEVLDHVLQLKAAPGSGSVHKPN